MTKDDETFFTTVGCMDGRAQGPVIIFGREKFGAKYPDTITEAGLVGILANNPSPEFLKSLKEKIDISINKHGSRGIIIHGHQDCAGNPISDEQHKKDVKNSVQTICDLIGPPIPRVIGVFVRRSLNEGWEIEEV